MFSSRYTWVSAEDAFTWNLDQADKAETYRRFGAAAALGPDGTVWSVLLLAA